MHFLLVFAQATSIGVASYILGLLPLAVKSQSRLSAFTVFGNGQLVGTAWSLVFVKVVMGAASTINPQQFNISRWVVTLADMGGMLFMWIVCRRISARTLDDNHSLQPDPDADAEKLSSSLLSSQEPEKRDGTEPAESEKNLDIIEQPAVVSGSAPTSASRTTPAIGPHQQRIYLFTLSLFIQLLVHGINEGHWASEISPTSKPTDNSAAAASLDYVYALRYLNALFEHAMMTFALSATLRTASFPIARCKHHLIAAAAMMPLAEMFSYTVITNIGISAAQYKMFPLFALRSFTDGMFIYAVFFLRGAIGTSDAKCGWWVWTTLLSWAGMGMSNYGPKLVLIPIRAFLKLVQRFF